ncbi:MAG: DUF6298 domain-containing protein [Gemmatimonadota bacterium]|nr:DUF6298 domain-containing protein [Gemmatimonadota bacterium]
MFIVSKIKNIIPLSFFCLLSCVSTQAPDIGPGPLRVHPGNPRYFTDNSGRAIYLTGSHTWSNLQEISDKSIEPFDYGVYLDFLEEYNHNFTRLWLWEHASRANWAPDTARIKFGPTLPYPRTGPGLCLDSLPRFDLSRFNQAHFDRLRLRVEAADTRGIYVMVMLFQGFSIEKKDSEKTSRGNPWLGHPMNRANNINGIDGDTDGNGQGGEVHTLVNHEVTRLQKAYIEKVVDTVNDLDNVLYEISNESGPESTQWQYEMIDYIHEYERSKPKQHPVVMTFQWPGGKNEDLFSSPAEAVSPNAGENEEYRGDPPASDGAKVILADTDHLWGIGGNAVWVWKSFLRGLNPIFMDPIRRIHHYPSEKNTPSHPEWESIRKNMGYTLEFAERMDLAHMKPVNDLASSGYCLAGHEADSAEYLVYLPEGGTVTVDLSATPGELTVQWFDPASGTITDTWTDQGGTANKSFTAPFEGDAVLYISRAIE